MTLKGRSPNIKEIEQKLLQTDPSKLIKIINHAKMTDQKGRYLYWDKLKYSKDIPEYCTAEEWWFGVKRTRNVDKKELPFVDTIQKPFSFNQFKCLFKFI